MCFLIKLIGKNRFNYAETNTSQENNSNDKRFSLPSNLLVIFHANSNK